MIISMYYYLYPDAPLGMTAAAKAAQAKLLAEMAAEGSDQNSNPNNNNDSESLMDFTEASKKTSQSKRPAATARKPFVKPTKPTNESNKNNNNEDMLNTDNPFASK